MSSVIPFRIYYTTRIIMGLDPKSIISFAIAFFYGLTIHEFFHAWTANKLGDPTARMQGRLTLNPIAHLDPAGTIVFVMSVVMSHGTFFFGWGKPVPVNPNCLKNPRRDDVLVSAAGPISNIVSALMFGLVLQILYKFTAIPPDLTKILERLILFNLVLAFFNLIPLYPLDGSHVLKGFLPRRALPRYENVCRYGPAILFGLVFFGILTHIPILAYIIWPPTIFFARIFTSFMG